MSKAIETFKSWAETIHQDVEALKKLVEADDAHAEARRYAAAALSYIVTRMDLIPDWNEGIGALDDAMVLRICTQLAQQHPTGSVGGEAEYTLGKLGNEAEKLADLLGRDIAGKLKAYCAKLTTTTVRGRNPQQIVDDEAARAALYGDVEEELKKSVPVVVTDPADAEIRLKAYLAHKLQ